MKIQLVEKKEHDGGWYYVKIDGTSVVATKDYEGARETFNFYVNSAKNAPIEEIIIREYEVTDEKLQTSK